MIYNYSRAHSVPALIVPIRLYSLDLRSETTLSAKVDTGASASAIPLALRSELGLTLAGLVRARGAFDQDYSVRQMFYLKIELPWAAGIVRTAKVLLTDASECLIGRDILNEYVLHADGPKQEFVIS